MTDRRPATGDRRPRREGERPATPEAAPEDVRHVAAEIYRILALASAEQHGDAREAAAALMFDFQPLLAAHPALRSNFTTALQRCRARQLLLRLAAAMHGDAA